MLCEFDGLRFWVQGSWFRVQGFRFNVESLGFRGRGLGLKHGARVLVERGARADRRAHMEIRVSYRLGSMKRTTHNDLY